MSYILIVAVFVIVLAGFLVGVFYMRMDRPLKKAQLSIGTHTISVEIADTLIARQRGLSGRKKMDSHEGMLFVFKNPSILKFWMYKMNFALDVVWIRDGIVIDITENVLPPSQTRSIATMQPSSPCNAALELTAGSVERFDIKVGDKVVTK